MPTTSPAGFTPVTNGEFFEDVTFATDPAEARIEQALLTVGASRANLISDLLAEAEVTRSFLDNRLDEFNLAIGSLQEFLASGRDSDLIIVGSGGIEQISQVVGATFPPPDGNFPYTVGGVTFENQSQITINRTTAEQVLVELRSRAEAVTGEAQVDLLRFQALVNRRNQAAEFLSNLIQRFFSQRERIAGNLRA